MFPAVSTAEETRVTFPSHARVGALMLGSLFAAVVAVVAVAVGPISTASAISAEQTVVYAEDPSVIANPARGWYHHTETHSYPDGTGWTPLDPAELTRLRAEGVTQVLRVVYLERYVDADLDPAVLAALDADLATARAAGVSVILRFAYAQGGAMPPAPPYGDAPVERVLAHIAQLTPVLRADADVIAAVQQGFIGLWGEGYYTDYFVADPADPSVVTDADWADRSRVLEALLAALPADRGVQVRTMQTKQKALGRPSGLAGALSEVEAFGGSDAARIGHHNDCFLASPDDFGTFVSDPLSLDQDYLAQETRFVPMGGETCAVNAPRSEWPSAAAELQRYHYSFLNEDFDRDVLDSWGRQNLAEVSRRLGYRFVLESSRVVDGAAASVSITLRNDGWAAPYTPRPVQIVLTGAAGDITVPVNADARAWAPGTEVTLEVPLGAAPAGEYRVALALPAPEPSIAADPRYAIRAANLGTWDAATGRNDLGQVVRVGGITPSSAASPATVPAASATPAGRPGPSVDRLPETGAASSSTMAAALGGLLLAAGAALGAITRGRRHRTPS
ncbi:hypothetical protein DBR36_06020 [Microbacterium sp. HMWF026]|nr:hypothetical protein DBR36_06020 [Microbacterium sp. HMWF026]